MLGGYAPLAIALAVLSSEPPHLTPPWPMVALGVAGVAAVLARRRWPALAFAGAIVLAVVSAAVGSGAELLLAVVAVGVAGVRGSARAAWACLGAALVAGALAALALTRRGAALPPILGLQPATQPRESLLDWANAFLIVAAVLVIAALLGVNAGHRRRHIAELEDRAERLARERDQQAETARALERERIAREMHDVIAHSLSVMIAISDGAHAAADERPDEAKRAIGRVADTGRRTLAEVRRLLGSVRGAHEPVVAEHAPQPDASQLPSLVAEFAVAGLPVRLAVEGAPPSDRPLGLAVYRIVQESLTNALRHARGPRSVEVSVTWAADAVTIAVRDDGAAASSSSGEGRGILGMQERVALYDGTVEAGPRPGGGWQVEARMRWEER